MRSPLRVELVQQRLEQAVSPRWQMFGLKPLSGKVDSRRVVVYATPRGKGDFGARLLDVRLIPDDGGTRLEGRFRLRWGNAIFNGIFLVVMSGCIANAWLESLSDVSKQSTMSSLGWVLLLVIVCGMVLIPVFSRSADRRLAANLERLLGTERPKELDGGTGS